MAGLKLRYVLDDLRPLAAGRVLDVGCGSGTMAKAIKRERPDLDVHGVDFSATTIATATRHSEGVTFAQAPAEALPFADGWCDAVTMFDVLEHVDDPGRVLSEIARVLKPGGLFHLVLPLEAQPRTIYTLIGCGTRWKAKVKYAGHIQIYSDSRYRGEAVRAGLPVRSVRWSYHYMTSLIDVAFFSIVSRTGPLKTSVEDATDQSRGWVRVPGKLAKSLVASIGWYESRALSRLTGACGHYLCIRDSG
ncbi:MAG: class I SAM-dependent methyltransferase [Candidatus Dormibacterales bacterium]